MAILEPFLWHLANRPEQAAVRQGADSYTYRQLYDRSSLYRDAISFRNHGEGGVIVLDMDRSFEATAAMLGVIRSGNAYTTIKRDYPARRRQSMMEELNVSLVVGSAFLEETGNVPRVRDASRTGESLAYVIFTSGTTGVPKAVGVADAAVVEMALEPRMGLFPGGRLSHLSPLEFDGSVLEQWGGLLNGMSLEVVSTQEVINAKFMLDFIATRVDIMWLTSSLFNFLVEKDAAAFAGVSRILTGGEPLSLAHVNRALQYTTIVNGYGPTENTVFATLEVMTSPVTSISIGTCVHGCDLAVVGEYGDRASEGELYVMGTGLAFGYLNDKAATSAAFVSFEGVPAYRTGDFVRQETDGRLSYIGRADQQVKVNGYRIDLQEVESAFIACGAGTCKAFMSAGTLTVAMSNEVPGIRLLVEEYLPPHMRPRKILRVDEMPLTDNGKTDVRALESRVADTGKSQVREVTTRITGFALDDSSDGLFELGLDSIAVWRLVSAINSDLGADVAFFDVLQEPTLTRLEQLVANSVVTPYVYEALSKDWIKP